MTKHKKHGKGSPGQSKGNDSRLDVTKDVRGAACVLNDSFADRLEPFVGRIEAALKESGKGARSDDGPWYRTPPVLISFVALIFSFGTTFVSYHRTAQQDVHDARTELRAFVDRLNSLPKESAELQIKYPGPVGANLAAIVNNQTPILAGQAYEVINRISDHVSPTECSVVGSALANTQDFVRAKQVLSIGLHAKASIFDELNLRKQIAAVDFLSNKVDDGRAEYQRALDTAAAVPNQSESTKEWMVAYAELAWATSEIGANQFGKGAEHIRLARSASLKVPPTGANNSVLQQVLVSLRFWATGRFAQGDLANGRHLFHEALLEESANSQVDPVMVQSGNCITELSWASVELATHNLPEARQHLASGKALYARSAAFMPNPDQFAQQLKRIDDAVNQAR